MKDKTISNWNTQLGENIELTMLTGYCNFMDG